MQVQIAYQGLSLAILIVGMNWTTAATNKMPQDFPMEAAIQVSFERLPFSVIGSNSVFAGMTGQPIFTILHTAQFNNQPAFVTRPF